jgi:hypothetical protein
MMILKNQNIALIVEEKWALARIVSVDTRKQKKNRNIALIVEEKYDLWKNEY